MPNSPPVRIAWDSTVCIDFFQKTVGRHEHILPIVKEATADPPKVVIVVSVMAIAEILRSEATTPDEHQKIIRAFFDSKHVYPQSCDRGIAELAQELRQTYPLNPADAIHVATAVYTQSSFFLTNDGDGKKTRRRLIPLDGKIKSGESNLRIMTPKAYDQMQYDLHNPLHQMMKEDTPDLETEGVDPDETEPTAPSKP